MYSFDIKESIQASDVTVHHALVVDTDLSVIDIEKRRNIQAKKGEGAPFHYNMSTFFGRYIVDYCLF